ncbi:hypothetical protein JTE90_005922 [Oedothorax gibbosus]|uniref:Uncharacterized protein n=1 Tax=Oedothorax gibbosus TaxID=931172 RepID=A0AAV6UA02_9ARAC|nr:hypothetical protein JTE90_005922 [Oedothorax gibbosus]
MLTYDDVAEYFSVVCCGFGCFFASLLLILFYHGVFYKVVVKSTKPPFTKDLYVVYKFTLNYTESRNLLAEVQSIAPDLESFSIYHEAFYQTKSQVGSSVGVILTDQMGEALYKKLLGAGYKVAIFPAVEYAVISSFPYRNYLSLALAVNRIYPKFKEYIKMNRLCAHPIMELYTKDTIYFIAPLSKQFDFYADEAITHTEDTSGEEEEEEELSCEEEVKKCTCATRRRHKTSCGGMC